MPRNGSGTQVFATNTWSPAVSLVSATVADYNTILTDIANGLTQSISKDGQTTYTGNQPMGTFKLTGLGAGTTAGDSVRFEQVFTSATETDPIIRQIPQNSQSTAYTLVLSDGGKHILHPSADTTARVFTIPANSSVAYPIGTAITFVNQNAAGTLTISITSDTMRLAGAGTTGSRTLAANGIATALKVASTEWIISGTNLT